MKQGILRLFVVYCFVIMLCSLTVHLVAGTLCLSARSVSGCQRCCQPDQADTQERGSACSLFCCTGLPGSLEVPIAPVLRQTVSLPGIQDLSTCLAPAPPPPRFSPSIYG